MPHSKFPPAQNFNRPIGATPKKSPRRHKSGGKSATDRQGLTTNHNAGTPQRGIL